MRTRIIILGILFLLSASEAYASNHATTKFVPLTGADVSQIELASFMTEAFKPDASMADFVNAAFRAAIGVGAMLAVLQLARAGFLYMGSDMWHKKEQARHLIQDAVIGLLLLLSVWIVLNQINPQILNLDVLSKVQAVPGGGEVNKKAVNTEKSAFPVFPTQTDAQKAEQEQYNAKSLDDLQYSNQ